MFRSHRRAYLRASRDFWFRQAVRASAQPATAGASCAAQPGADWAELKQVARDRKRELRSAMRAESRAHGHRASSFGVRRPLRYLAYQLELDDAQMRQVAAVLNRLKTEHEQAALDERRASSALADAFEGDDVGTDAIAQALTQRQSTTERLAAETEAAVKALFAALDADQRERLADLMRAGSFSL